MQGASILPLSSSATTVLQETNNQNKSKMKSELCKVPVMYQQYAVNPQLEVLLCDKGFQDAVDYGCLSNVVDHEAFSERLRFITGLCMTYTHRFGGMPLSVLVRAMKTADVDTSTVFIRAWIIALMESERLAFIDDRFVYRLDEQALRLVSKVQAAMGDGYNAPSTLTALTRAENEVVVPFFKKAFGVLWDVPLPAWASEAKAHAKQ